jgi:hypothetical protein
VQSLEDERTAVEEVYQAQRHQDCLAELAASSLAL